MPLLDALSKTYDLSVDPGVTTKTVDIDISYNEPGGVDLLVSAKSANVTQVQCVVLFSDRGGSGSTDRERLWISDETEGKGLVETKALGTTDETQFVQSWDKPPTRWMRLRLIFTVADGSSESAEIFVYRRDGR